MMKLTAVPSTARATVVVFATAALVGLSLLAATACGGSSSTATGATASTTTSVGPRPVAGDPERTEFAPVLHVHLDSMVKRASGLYVQDRAMGTGGVATRGR